MKRHERKQCGDMGRRVATEAIRLLAGREEELHFGEKDAHYFDGRAHAFSCTPAPPECAAGPRQER